MAEAEAEAEECEKQLYSVIRQFLSVCLSVCLLCSPGQGRVRERGEFWEVS